MDIHRYIVEKLQPAVTVDPGDSIELVYTDKDGKSTTVMTQPIGEQCTFTHGVVFFFTNGFGAKRGIGGAFLEDVTEPTV